MLKVIELFAGVGAQASALERLKKDFNFDYEIVAISEIDKYASESYKLIHGKVNNLGDITKIERLPKADFWTYSSPCQDISQAGKQKGFEKGSGTRSGLLWEVDRLLQVAKEHNELPKYLLMENVKALISDKFYDGFLGWLDILKSYGYKSFWKVLNAKDYGVPQNRERVFVVSILDKDAYYEFPRPFKLEKRLKDVLEQQVDEKYYLSQKMVETFTYNYQKQKEKGNGFKFEPTNGEGIAKTITTLARNRMDDNFIFGNKNLNETLEKNKDKLGEEVLSIDAYNKSVHKDITQTITTRVNDSNQHFVYEGASQCIQVGQTNGAYERANRTYSIDGVSPTITTAKSQLFNIEEPIIAASRGRNPIEPNCRTIGIPTEQRLEINKDGVANTLTTIQKDNYVIEPKIIKEEPSLKEQMCNKLIEEGLVKENDVIRHSYTHSRMSGKMKDIQENNMSPTIDTRCDCLGVVVKEEPIGTYNYNASDKFMKSKDRENIGNDTMSCIKTNGPDSGIITNQLRIRKLTPKECWRLMGFTDNQFDKVGGKISNAQLYKQAGNSIVVDVLYYIFKELFINQKDRHLYVKESNDNTSSSKEEKLW